MHGLRQLHCLRKFLHLRGDYIGGFYSDYFLLVNPSPASVSWSTLLGLLNNASVPPAVFGNAITSRIDVVLHSTAISLSNPIASPPCGGAPAESAASRCEKVSVSAGVSYKM
jgi:hypothetical protein